MSRGRVFNAAIVVAVMALAAFASSALARNLYVANYNSDTVSVIDATTNQIAGTIQNGLNTGPWTLAISPDGKTVYVSNYDSGGINTIDTATNQIVGTPIATPASAWGMAISPDGTRGYFTTESKLFTVDLQARQLVGTPVEVCLSTDVIVTPDGARAYVVCESEVVVVDLASNAVVGEPIPVEKAYLGTVSPDGKFVYLGNRDGGSVTVIDTATNQTSSIATGGHPESVAVSPDGKRAYVSDEEGEGIITVDTATRQVVGPLFPLSIEAEYIAVSPDGRKLFTNSEGQDVVAGIDLSTSQKIGPLSTGDGAGPLAFIPDQSPTASFAPTAKVRPGVPTTLSGAASSDPDGTVSTFAWQFGDGGAKGAEPSWTTTHTYAKPGSYPVTLTVTDNEGCSVAMVYTGHTASCHGSPAAASTQTVVVNYPGVKVKCPKKAGAKGCVFKLKAVQKKGKGKKQKLIAQSAVAKVKVKAGKSAIVSLKPKSKFAQKLATAARALVEQTVTKNGKTTTKVSKLKIVQ